MLYKMKSMISYLGEGNNMARHNIERQCWYCWECDREFDYESQADDCDCEADNEEQANNKTEDTEK